MRLSTVIDPAGTVTLVVGGTLNAECVADFDRALEYARGQGEHVAVDMARVRLIDRPTLQYLVDTLTDVRVINCPDYIKRWMKREANA